MTINTVINFKFLLDERCEVNTSFISLILSDTNKNRGDRHILNLIPLFYLQRKPGTNTFIHGLLKNVGRHGHIIDCQP
jgi:hypothetical protein